jgi:hypothetical protein
VKAEPNPDAAPRTAERPQFEELPRPRTETEFEDRPTDDRSFDRGPMNDEELPSPKQPY